VSEPFDPWHEAPEPEPEHVHLPWHVQWRSAMIAALVFATVVGVVVYQRDHRGQSAPVTTSTSTTAPGVCGTPNQAITCFAQSRIVRRGDRGEDVRRIQQRLKDLHFDPGYIDGVYGGDTIMAVWAFQGVVMKRTKDVMVDFVTPEVWDIMRGDVAISPRRQPGTPQHVEIDLPTQTMTVFQGQKLLLVTHISSGTGEQWCEEVTIDPGEEGNKTKEPIKKGVCGEAKTPGGIYRFYMRKLGQRESKLGTMWNPVYFNFGLAIHGAMQVPAQPASHGCIRIPIFISEYFPVMVKYNDRVYIWDGVKEPEEYGSQPPPWDKDDPNYTTTTSSTSTSVPKTPKTTVPKVTVPPATTPAVTSTTAG
jgi:hypothetical protein